MLRNQALVNEYNQDKNKEKNSTVQVICFHNPDEENGYLSNWYMSDFIVDGIKYSSMEQYMMYMKALTFNDTESADKILSISDVAEIKELGRNVKNYNDVIWNGVRQVIIYKGLTEKFKQSIELRELIIFTGEDVLAECAVSDKIWGKKEERTVVPFNNYDEVELSFTELREIIDGHYYDYYDALSVVKGIYMIIDGNTGKLYVGSAYGGDGIWGRWSSYAATCHGGNYELQKLYDQYGEEYFYKFKYIILQILPMRMSDKEVIEM